MNGTQEDQSDDIRETARAESGPDDFSTSEADAHERRLHLRAFDYWHALKGDRTYPLFKDLSPAGLAPFKKHSLLLEFSVFGATVRFAGDRIVSLMETEVTPGARLEDLPHSPFASALLGQFEDAEARTRAAEFEFVEDFLDCRGIMLPLSRTGEDANFLMVVVSFRQREEWSPTHGADAEGAGTTEAEEAAEAAEDAALAEALRAPLDACEEAVSQVAHLDGGGRDNLYHALAAALRLYEEASLNPAAYDALLVANGLKVQTRAPYTPVLKLTFGRDYDKTRLTEYASALAFAVREGQTSDTLAAFLRAQPGGIKGCVRAERAARRGRKGTPAEERQRAATEAMRAAKAHDLTTLASDDEFCLVLARRADGGGLEAIGVADCPPTEVEAAIRRLHQKK
nr:PAS domain-containing protein [Kordiimonas gwangyangensis]